MVALFSRDKDKGHKRLFRFRLFVFLAVPRYVVWSHRMSAVQKQAEKEKCEFGSSSQLRNCKSVVGDGQWGCGGAACGRVLSAAALQLGEVEGCGWTAKGGGRRLTAGDRGYQRAGQGVWTLKLPTLRSQVAGS